MLRITKINFSRLTDEQHYNFMLGVQYLLDSFPNVKALVAQVTALFFAKLELENELLNATRTSYSTRQLKDADRRVGRCITAIKKNLDAALLYPDSAMAESARQLVSRLENLGNIVHKSYEAKTAAVQVLLREFGTTFAPQSALVGLAPKLTELTEAEQAFINLYGQRTVENVERAQGRLLNVRRDMQADYGKITACVEDNTIGNGEAKCGEFVNLLNELVKSFSERPAKRNLKHAIVDNIPDQPFTSKVITPIPTVRYTTSKGEMQELSFAKDFSVFYKNNLYVGTAELTISGKGDNKGKKTVMFQIVGSQRKQLIINN
jgi:hypothetical protein